MAAVEEVERDHGARQIFMDFRDALTEGKVRAAEKVGNEWVVNTWVKQGILLGFRLGELSEMAQDASLSFVDKDTFPARRFTVRDRVRVVPGGSSVRVGSYVAPGVICMPPMFINVGAYVDEGTMVDSHALVGSCAQIGKRVHLSAAAQIGGVLEPINAAPVVIEDAPAGIRAAHAGGMNAIAITSTFPPGELKEADAVITALSQIRVRANGDNSLVVELCR